MRVAIRVLTAILLTGLATPVAHATPADCPTVVDEKAFASQQDLENLNATIAGFGLRTTASPAHRTLTSRAT